MLVARKGIADQLNAQKDNLPNNLEIIVPKEGTDEELIKLVPDVEIIICSHITAEVAKAATQLKLLHKTGIGVDDLPFDAIRKDVYIANTSGAKPYPFAEGAIAFILALAKQLVLRHNLFPKRTSLESFDLRGKKVGIIGLGHIGSEIAKRLQAFEMTILGLKRLPSEELKTKLGLEFLGGPEDLPYLLKESDFVVVTIPLTPTTRGMIGENELRMMKPTAFLINIARAAIIEEEPLYRALKEGWIAGAGIDVWWNQYWWNPIWSPDDSNPSKYPIWELPNVITTPHNIGLSNGVYSEAALKILMENINRIAAGKPPINQVDMEYQY